MSLPPDMAERCPQTLEPPRNLLFHIRYVKSTMNIFMCRAVQFGRNNRHLGRGFTAAGFDPKSGLLGILPVLDFEDMVSPDAYLERMGYAGVTNPNPETLRALHRAHLFAVPFENLDIGLKRTIPCDADAAVRKIVEQRRGGFCYELNGAFAWLLRALGFQVTLLSARVGRPDGSLGPEYDHLTLRVDLDQPWLADVGFGDSFLDPLRLQPELEQEQESERFRIVEADSRLRVEKHSAQGWTLEYSFSPEPRDCLSSRECAVFTRPLRNRISRVSAYAPWRVLTGVPHCQICG